MSYHISGGGAPQWAGLQGASPLAQEGEPDASSDPASAARAAGRLHRGAGAGARASEEDWRLALVPQAFFNGDRAFAAFLQSPQGLLATAECQAAFRCLEDVLAGPRGGRLPQALDQAARLLAVDEEQHAEMLGHGKRWLCALLQLLVAPATLTADRLEVCAQLEQRLCGAGAQPAQAFGRALTFLQGQAFQGQEAQAIRQLVHRNTLSGYLRAEASLCGSKELIDTRLKDLLSGFGFRDSRPATASAARRPQWASQLNSAAQRLQDKQRAHLLLVAHDILDRVQTAFKAIWNCPVPTEPVFQPGQVHAQALMHTLDLFGRALRFNLRRLMELPPGHGGQARFLSLHDPTPLSVRLGEQLPELAQAEGAPADTGRRAQLLPAPAPSPRQIRTSPAAPPPR